jgi:K+-transporting ATPase c subunit
VVRDNRRPRLAGFFGEPGIDVLDLNLALDRLGTGAR